MWSTSFCVNLCDFSFLNTCICKQTNEADQEDWPEQFPDCEHTYQSRLSHRLENSFEEMENYSGK